MKKSDGILSLKKAAKLLNKHSPEGESLAYINPEEAKLLRSHGGSGIMTLAGVPSYWDWGETWETIKNIAQPVTNWLGYTGGQGGGQQLMKDLASLWGGYEGMKESKELSEFQKQQYQEQKDKEALNQLLFAQQTDSGKQLLAPTNVPTSVEDISVFKEATGIPSLKTTAVAEGGRIGYRGGGDMAHRLSELIKKSNAGTITPQEEHEMAHLEIMLDYGPGEAQGGRIGYAGGTESGYTFEDFKKEKRQVDQFMGEEQLKKLYEKMMREKKIAEEKTWAAQGGRIGYRLGDKVVEDRETMAESITLPDGGEEVVTDSMTEIEGQTAGGGERGWQAQMLAEDLAQEQYGKGFYDLSEDKQYEIYTIALDMIDSGGNAKGGLPKRVRKAPGGIMNLGGLEKDYRTTGGFVPIGGREKADDVPARLSKNEFVMTADAVRAAGGGSINKGAQLMYDTMKNLEARPQAQRMTA